MIKVLARSCRCLEDVDVNVACCYSQRRGSGVGPTSNSQLKLDSSHYLQPPITPRENCSQNFAQEPSSPRALLLGAVFSEDIPPRSPVLLVAEFSQEFLISPVPRLAYCSGVG